MTVTAELIPGRGYVFDSDKAIIDIAVDTMTKGFFGYVFTCLFTTLPPLGGAIFLGSVQLIKAVTTPIFQMLFNQEFFGKLLHNVIAIKGASLLTDRLGFAALGFSFGHAIVGAALAYAFFSVIGIKL